MGPTTLDKKWAIEMKDALESEGFPHTAFTDLPASEKAIQPIEAWLDERTTRDTWRCYEEAPVVDFMIWGFKDENVAIEFKLRWS